MGMNDINSLSHTKWNCKYHIVFAPKYSISGFMGYLKGKSSTTLYEQFGELKYKYRNREFWCRGYYVDTVGKSDSPFTGRKQQSLRSWQIVLHVYALREEKRAMPVK